MYLLAKMKKVVVPLIGPLLGCFSPNRIPTKREALQVIFCYNYVEHYSIPNSIKEVASVIIELEYEGHRIKRKDLVQACLQRLYNEWRSKHGLILILNLKLNISRFRYSTFKEQD